ncbi:MAG TPA: endonuclease MutS2 [Terriglobales bacterium]|nr:endonuclease MutS2 [Terriglobales bacterium]
MALLAHTSSRVLEFDALRDILRAYIASPLGQQRVAALAPSADRDWIDRQQQLTDEIREFLRAGARFDFAGLLDPTKLVDKARIEGAALEPLEVWDVVLVTDRADEWRHLAAHPPAQMAAPFARVTELSSAIADFTDFLRFFRNKILPDGTLDDRASPELARIRREIEKQKRLIQESLRAYVRRLADAGAVQEELVTIRGERFVIPVKVDHKKHVSGVVHGASSSGQTVFIEPLETIEQNNDLVRLLEEEQTEIHRILLEMTSRIRDRAVEILSAVDALAELELQFAKARFAQDYNCVRPIVWDSRPRVSGASEARLLLHQARHPLLERTLKPQRRAIVPIAVELEADHRQLVISGPNTGGKTVALKTVGLLVLMAQAGVPVPADRAELPIFDAVLADIGDYQSIEQNLSTFSAHVTNIDFISRTATPGSLVLLDELGSATDPAEGAALAVAIADYFRHLGCFTVISTHHTSLKVYAANTDGVLNAAVGFDETTLQPTFELKMGVPGASAGINVAQRLGLNPEIIAAARASLGSQAQDVARFLDRLHAELRQAEEERRRISTREQELIREQKRLEAEGLKEQRARVKEMERKLDALLRDFEYRARETVEAVQERAAALKLSKDAERRIARLRREFKEQFDSGVVAHATGADVGDPHARPGEVKYVEEGDTVKLKSLGRNAIVKRRIDQDTFEVEVGAMKMKVPRDDLAEVIIRAADSPLKAARARGISVSVSEDSSVPSEINVIGATVDVATARVEKFLDRAFLAGLSRLRIVHGSGLGVLRKALREYLKQHPHVASVSEPPQNEGGAGATMVELKV